MNKPRYRCAVFGLVVLVSLIVPNPIVRSRAVHAQAPPAAPAELFAVSTQGASSTNEVYRFGIGGSQDQAVLEDTITDPSFNAPGQVTFNAAGEMFVVNRGPQNGYEGSVTRFLHAETHAVPNGVIASPNFAYPTFAGFRGNELFVANSQVASVLRFAVNGAGNATENGAITDGLTTGVAGKQRGIAVAPWGELFVAQCCGYDSIVRYVFDANGNAIFNGYITGGGISSPHGMTFSPQGELFVANLGNNTISRFGFDAQHNAASNGQIAGDPLSGTIDVAFSPWGELFVSHHFAPGGITRWTFDASGNAVPNGTFPTPNTLAGIAFSPLPGGSLPPNQFGQLFANACHENDVLNQVYRINIAGPSSPASLDATITDPDLDQAAYLAFGPRDELFVVNRGPQTSPDAGRASIARILGAQGSPVPNGKITSPAFSGYPGGPHGIAFRGDELFVANPGSNNVLRFVIDGAGNATPNGSIGGLGGGNYPLRGVAVAPWGELFVSECCGTNAIARFVFDGAGNAVPSGIITGGGLNNPHGMKFSPWGELFVANNGSNNVVRITFDNEHNASFNGQIDSSTMYRTLDVAFSPWGELYVSNENGPRGISRFVFDTSHNAIYNGFIDTPTYTSGLAFGPREITACHSVWTNTSSMATSRFYHSATLLPNGKVLVVGGGGGSTGTSQFPQASAELYDPATGTWSPTGSMHDARTSAHTATLLPNGKVLVAGGIDANFNALSSAELYDPATGTWALTGSMHTSHRLHTATLLANGKVLVAAGQEVSANGGNFTPTSELYDPATGTWSITGSMTFGRYAHTATLLADGRVLAAGGYNPSNGILSSAEIYDPATGTWSPTGNMNSAHSSHAATLLPNGKVLVTGGVNGSNVLFAGADLYDPTAGVWTNVPSMHVGRVYHAQTTLPDGKVLVTGGGTDLAGATAASTELYDPSTNTWSDAAAMNGARDLHTATLLPDGRVLVTGGYNVSGILATAEVYGPDGETCPLPPTLALPQPITAEAIGPSGATVTFTATATASTGASLPVACTPASGSTFPLGTTTVTCSATDAQQTATGTFTVQVRDTTPPTISGVPANQIREATSAAGAVVSYTAPTASDLVDGAVPVTCSPASGCIFALGTTTVTCSATDHAGNAASASFTVSVGYSWSGILQPINTDGSSVFRRGSTVPVKFRLTGASGAITNAVARLSYQFVDGSAGSVNEAVSTAQATTGNLFRYDPTSGQYIFNWSTTGLAVGTYDLYIDLGDGVQRTVRLQLR